MDKLKYLAVLFSFLILLGCGERKADVKNAVLYNKEGVSFNLPGNWAVTEDEEDDGIRYLFVETPGDALVVIHVFANIDEAPRLEDYADFFVQESMNNMPVGSRSRGLITEIHKTLGDKAFHGYRNAFTATFVGQEYPHTVEFFSVSSSDRSAYLTTQVADEDLPKVEKGFEQIISSFALTD